MEGYELKLNNQYTLSGMYLLTDYSKGQNDPSMSFDLGFADILLMEGSDAIQSLAAATTALIAVFTF